MSPMEKIGALPSFESGYSVEQADKTSLIDRTARSAAKKKKKTHTMTRCKTEVQNTQIF